MKQKRCLSFFLALALLIGLLPALPVSAGYETGYCPESGDGSIVAHGVDLSAWQGNQVDFQKIKAQGYSFVILRAGYATTEDRCFEENYARAREAGLDIGIYLYSYADTVQEALEEAAACKRWLRDKVLEYPVYYDLEEPEKHGQMSASALTTLALAFLDEMAADGWLAGLYSCRSWFDSKYELSRISDTYECWIAQYYSGGTYDSYSQYTQQYGMWQYSASGEVDGVPGNTDMNVCFRDYPAICRQYGFNGYPATGETIWLQGGQAPAVLATGQSLALEGRVISTGGKLSSVSLELYSSEGALLLATASAPRTERYELSQLNGRLKLERLSSGSYRLRLTAQNEQETRVLLEQSLVLSKAGLRLDDANQPVNLKEGDSFAPTGIVQAAQRIESLEVGINDYHGQAVTVQRVQPETALYDLAGLQAVLHFDELTMGSYQYFIRASTSAGSETLLSVSFQVWVRSDPVVFSGFTLEAQYLPGELQSLGGTIRSTSSRLRQVTATVYDMTGAVVTEAKLNLNTKSTSFDRLDQMLALSALDAGTYLLVVTALNNAGTQTLLNQSFCIIPDMLSLCEPALPSLLRAGDSFCMEGVVVSDQSPLKSVSVTVTDDSGRRVLHAAALPEQNGFDLAGLNQRMLFSTLPEGNYVLRVAAENSTSYHTLYEAPLYVTEHADLIFWEDGCYRPAGRSYSNGSAPRLWGTVCSAQSALSEIRVEILTQSGRLLTQASRTVDANTAALDTLNERLHLSALANGTYRYRVSATNASGTYILLEEPFTISACQHAYAVTGTQYAPDCTTAGAVGDSHCADCGGRIACGYRISGLSHAYQNGNCQTCGKKEPNILTLAETQTLPGEDAWLVLAVEQQGAWYALDENGVLVALTLSAAGEIQVPRTLTWRLRRKCSGGQQGFALVNTAGQALHLDTDGMQIAFGTIHALMELIPMKTGFQIRFLHDPDTLLSIGGTTEVHLFARESINP